LKIISTVSDHQFKFGGVVLEKEVFKVNKAQGIIKMSMDNSMIILINVEKLCILKSVMNRSENINVKNGIEIYISANDVFVWKSKCVI